MTELNGNFEKAMSIYSNLSIIKTELFYLENILHGAKKGMVSKEEEGLVDRFIPRAKRIKTDPMYFFILQSMIKGEINFRKHEFIKELNLWQQQQEQEQ